MRKLSDKQKKIDAFLQRVDSDIPMICPKCGRTLDQVMGALLRDSTRTFHGGSLNLFRFTAECPSCKHVLLEEAVGSDEVGERFATF